MDNRRKPLVKDQSAIVESCKSVVISLSACDPDDDEITWVIDVNPSQGYMSANYPEIQEHRRLAK